MKKILVIFISVIFMFGSCIPAFAQSNYSNLYDDAKDIKPIENKILDDLNTAIIKDNQEKISFDNLDYDGILKIYDASDWLEKSEFNLDELNSLINNSIRFYRLYFHLNNDYINATVTKGAEPTDDLSKEYSNEEIAYLKENVIGKWHVQSYAYDKSNNPNYKQNIENVIKNSKTEYSKIHFAANLSKNIHLAAILITENSEIQFNILEGVVNNKTINCDNPDDTLYYFEELKEIAEKHTATSEVDDPLLIEIGGPTSDEKPNNKPIIIATASAGASILIAAAGIIIFIKKKKAKASAELSE